MYQFTDDCKIGIPQIDDEHRYLFELVNQAFDILHSPDADHILSAKELLHKLYDYAATHFAHEETYMESIHDPELPRQKKEHEAFAKKVSEQLSSGELTDTSLNDLLVFLTKWLYRHILSSDMMIGKLSASEAANKSAYQFTDQYLTGIDLIDEEHKQLFSIIADIERLIHNDLLHDKYDEIMHILGELRIYTEKHFGDEENYMEQISFPGLEMQKHAHAAFIEKLVEVDLSDLDEMDDNQQEYLDSLLDFLAGWLVNHILRMDKQIGAFQNKTM